MSTPDPGFLGGIDPASALAADLEADFHAEAERQVIGHGDPKGFDGMLAALGEASD